MYADFEHCLYSNDVLKYKAGRVLRIFVISTLAPVIQDNATESRYN